MKKFLPKFSSLRQIRFQLNTGGWLSVVIIAAITLLIAVNLWKVGVNAQESFDVFLSEQDSLSGLEAQNEKLKSELEYYQSYEYKKLYARDNLRLAEANEKLFKVIEPIDYYSVEETLPEFFTEGEYGSWWLELI